MRMRSGSLVAAMAVSALALAACGDSGGSSQTAAAPAKPAEAAKPATPAAPAPAAAPASPAAAPASPAAPATAPAAGAVAIDVVDKDGNKMSGDPAAGKTVFRQCQACHTLEPGKNMTGPTLHGIIGRPAGTVEGYNYSKANKDSGITWTEQVMFEYLEAPQQYIKGTKMAFAGLKKPQDRADVIAYIQEESKGE
jgi:cytochrome c